MARNPSSSSFGPGGMTDDRPAVAAALEAVGAHRCVRIEVTDVGVHGTSVEIDLVIHYPCATPVCCAEPGCYLGFLGLNRRLVPDALGHALGIEAPAVTIRAQLRYEPGYFHIDLRTGDLVNAGVDYLATYPQDHFR